MSLVRKTYHKNSFAVQLFVLPYFMHVHPFRMHQPLPGVRGRSTISSRAWTDRQGLIYFFAGKGKEMCIRRISLRERLKKLNDGNYPYEEYCSAVLERIAGMPIREYFSGYPKEMKKFQNYMHLTDEQIKGITYGEAVHILHDRCKGKKLAAWTDETNALFLLSWLAMDYCTKTRKQNK